MEKEIDATYDAVIVRCSRDDVGEVRALVTSEAAVNYYISRFLGRNVRHLLCPRCGELHLDMDFFAVNVHRRHLCHGCGHYFNDDRRAVSNPIALVRENLSKVIAAAEPQRPDRPLSISQLDHPGGIQIWASNPAIVWTAERPEEEGVHVHAFSSHGVIAFDETFSEATIDGINVDETQVQHFMAQSALPYLAKRVLSLKCPDCGNRHFDRGGVCSSP